MGMRDKMTIEETINGLQEMIESKKFIENHYDGVVDEDVCERAIELLKEQEDRIGVLTRAIEQMPKPTKLLDVFGNGYAKIVRCKNCKHWNKDFDGHCTINHIFTIDDWFCADGERK